MVREGMCSFAHPQGNWVYLSGSIHEYTWNDGRYMHTYVHTGNLCTHTGMQVHNPSRLCCAHRAHATYLTSHSDVSHVPVPDKFKLFKALWGMRLTLWFIFGCKGKGGGVGGAGVGQGQTCMNKA